MKRFLPVFGACALFALAHLCASLDETDHQPLTAASCTTDADCFAWCEATGGEDCTGAPSAH